MEQGKPFSSMMHLRRFSAAFLGLLLLTLGVVPRGVAQQADGYLAVLSAFEPEMTRLLDAAAVDSVVRIGGRRYHVGTLAGNPVVLVLTGIGLGRAEETTRALLDAFPVAGIVFSGIAGGINPDLGIGDVTIPTQWTRHDLPPDSTGAFVWYPVGAVMLAVAQSVADSVDLAGCTTDGVCVQHPPHVAPGGNGVSGSRFVSNAALRRQIWDVFEADVVDMETAAVARVAREGQVPFLAFRALSDLASGGAGDEFATFFQLAADNAASVVVAFLEAWAARRAEAVAVEAETPFPDGFHLDPPYPNPFRTRTSITFTLPASRFVTLEAFDVLGRKVATVAAQPFTAGHHQIVWEAGDVPSGVYFLRWNGEDRSRTRTVVRF